MTERYPSVRCDDCGRSLTWIEIAFGRLYDPCCGRCLMNREEALAFSWDHDIGGEG